MIRMLRLYIPVYISLIRKTALKLEVESDVVGYENIYRPRKNGC